MKSRILLLILSASIFSGCGLMRIDPWHVLIRSDVITSVAQEKEILSRASLSWTDDHKVRVLVLRGTPYERGYQQGVLLRDEVKENLTYLYDKALSKFHFPEMFDESYERMRPYIPEEYVEEMHGLAHGARIPLRVVHAIHALPEIGEWGGKRNIVNVVKSMMHGTLEKDFGAFGTSCSNFCAMPGAAANNDFYTVRVLDWGLHRISKLHEYPLITINIPDHGLASANIGWVGFLGAVSGMNEAGITLGEMGYGDIPGETLRGKPMPFLLRDVMTYAHSLPEVRKVISTSKGTNAFVFLMSDGKTRTSELYIRDKDRFIVKEPGTEITDRNQTQPGLKNVLYGGHYKDRLVESLSSNEGKITPEVIMHDIVPKIAMPSNFQDVIYDPVRLRFWVANAKSKSERAAEQPYTFFDLRKALTQARSKK